MEYITMTGDAKDIEVDMTSLIVNPSFEESSSTPKGWTVEGKATMRSNSNLDYTVFGPAPSSYYISADADSRVAQTVTGLKPGKYSLSAWLGASETSTTITLTAGDKSQQVTGHPFGKHYLTQAVVDEIVVGEDGTLDIQVMGDATYFVDDFKLTYLGKGGIDTAIDIITDASSVKSDAIYTISGQRVNSISHPGIYIVGGKKLLKR